MIDKGFSPAGGFGMLGDFGRQKRAWMAGKEDVIWGDKSKQNHTITPQMGWIKKGEPSLYTSYAPC